MKLTVQRFLTIANGTGGTVTVYQDPCQIVDTGPYTRARLRIVITQLVGAATKLYIDTATSMDGEWENQATVAATGNAYINMELANITSGAKLQRHLRWSADIANSGVLCFAIEGEFMQVQRGSSHERGLPAPSSTINIR